MVRLYDRTSEWLQERGRPFVMVVGIIVGIVVLYVAGSSYFDYRRSNAETAFAQAVEKFNAPVQDSTTPASPTTGKTYTDEQTKWQESADAFDQLSRDYSGYYGAIGRYYSGVCYLHLNQRDKGIGLLQQAADANDEPTSDLARLALAEAYVAGGDADKAIAAYEQLLKSSISMKPAIQLGLGRAYEKAGDKDKAVDAYVEAAKADRSSGAGPEAEKRISVLAPDRLKDLPAPSTA